jgi:1,4-alpha-glucan branching enzyme
VAAVHALRDRVRPPALELGPVRFEFLHPTATSVCVAGTFNGWNPVSKPLRPGPAGRWLKETVLTVGTHEYRFVVDGEWMPDPRAPESVPNPFGGTNSVVRVARPVPPSP